ncbi:MAG: DegV family EDD domain-containing protein [Christensenellaceae bacterium]|nr:DegV family EDD domain-containing protein [Christensenellaceae bacterium]
MESLKLKVNHWVAIDDLEYLKRGGRISPTVAVVGKALGIKPIIHVNNEGKLVNVLKARGRKNAMQTLINKYGELAEDTENGLVFISHSDCENEAKELAKQLKERYGVEVRLTTFIGTVIGAHTGPGTLVLFFVGKNR